MTPAILFHSCENYAEPIWSRFDALELQGRCVVLECQDGSVTETVFSRKEAQFFAIAGHLKEGGCEDITDVFAFEMALNVARVLERRSGLQLSIYC